MKLGWQIRAALFFVTLLSTKMFAQATTGVAIKNDLFGGTEKFAQNASSVTQIDMDPSSFGQVRGGEQNQARRMLLSIVHSYEYDSPGMYKMADVEVYRRKLQSPDWHCSVQMHDARTGNSNDVCSRVRTDGNREEAVISVQPKMLTFIHTIRKPKPPVP